MPPLQDITDRILSNSTRHGTKNIPSSLPPSSPPSTSSHLPEPNCFTNNGQLSSLPILSSDEFCIPAGDGEKLDIAEYSGISELSDPFGFFALEKKLKSQRVVASHRKARTRHRFDSHTALPTQTKRDVTGVGNLGVFSPSIPSTPSPFKCPANRARTKASLSVENAQESELVIHKASKERQAPLDERPVIQQAPVKTVKPKSSIGRAGNARNQSKAPDGDDDTEQDVLPGRKGRAKRNTKKRGTTARKLRERIKEQEVLDCDHEERTVRSHISLELVALTNSSSRRKRNENAKCVWNTSRGCKTTILKRRTYTLFDLALCFDFSITSAPKVFLHLATTTFSPNSNNVDRYYTRDKQWNLIHLVRLPSSIALLQTWSCGGKIVWSNKKAVSKYT